MSASHIRAGPISEFKHSEAKIYYAISSVLNLEAIGNLKTKLRTSCVTTRFKALRQSAQSQDFVNLALHVTHCLAARMR